MCVAVSPAFLRRLAWRFGNIEWKEGAALMFAFVSAELEICVRVNSPNGAD